MKFLNRAYRLVGITGLTLLLSATAGLAASAVHHRAATTNQGAIDITTKFKNAKPMEKRLKTKPAFLNQTRIPVQGGAVPGPVVRQGDTGPVDQVDTAPDTHAPQIQPQNYGTGNQNSIYHYSDYLLPNALRKLYPYRATGYFFFTQQGGDYYCTGSLIAPSLLLVAGHCVHAGNNSDTGWDTQGVFYPASSQFGGYAPYEYATAYSYWTWSGWYSTGSLDQGYDVGLVVLNKRINKTKEIGRYTGWLGFCTGACLQAYWFFTQLGYPGNYYDGANMTVGQHLYASDSRDYVWGSGMRGGSSGGPHIANIGDLSDSAANAGLWPYRNIVFAPTSWGYDDSQYKIQGGSALTGPNNTFDFNHVLFNSACREARQLHGRNSCTLFP